MTATDTAAAVTDVARGVERLSTNMGYVIQGKPEVIHNVVVCLLAEGHLLLEDVPGTGKTSIARALATSLSVTWHRIQFTPDLLPSDVTGVSIYNQATPGVRVQEGPDLRQHRRSATRSTARRRRPSRRCSR